MHDQHAFALAATHAKQIHPHLDLIEGYRALADLLAAHPDLPRPVHGLYHTVWFSFWNDSAKTDMARVRNLIGGKFKKEVDRNYFTLIGELHGLTIKLNAFRDDVCTRVVVGTEIVVEEIPDPKFMAEVPTVLVREEREVVEWKCPPILDGE